MLMFFSASVLSLTPSIGPSGNSKKLYFDDKYEMMNYYESQKLQHF